MKRIFIGDANNAGWDITNRKKPHKYIMFPNWIGDRCVSTTVYRFRPIFSNSEVDVYAEKNITNRQIYKILLTAYMKTL